jgi:hypothetical protein
MDERVERIMAAYLEDSQQDANRQALEAALQAGELEAGEVAQMQAFYARLENLPLPEPGPELRTNFYQMLAREKQKQQTKNAWRQWLNRLYTGLLQTLPLGKLAYSLVLLALGAGLGFWYQQSQSQQAEKLAALTSEMQQMKKMMMLTLLEQPSATDRLKAVNLTTDMSMADDRVIRALLQTLNNDPSVNVRLAAIEALYQHAGNPLARQGLVQSIGRQDSPLVQLALADIMLAMQEKKSVKQLEQLLKKEDLNESVKTRVKQAIQVLI